MLLSLPAWPPSAKTWPLLWDALCWEVYLQVHPHGHWEKGPGTPWESPEELWAVRYEGLGHGVHGSQLRAGQYVIPQSRILAGKTVPLLTGDQETSDGAIGSFDPIPAALVWPVVESEG